MHAANASLSGLRVFVSYPRGGLGHTWAEWVQAHLEARGADVFRDETSVEEGEQDWEARIATALERADVLVCVVCADTAASRWMKREMLRADELDKPVIPLRVDNAALPFSVREKQPVEHRGQQADTLARLAGALFRVWQASLVGAAPAVPGASVADVLATRQRQRELAWLNDLVFRRFADLREIYTPVSGREEQSRSLERTLRCVPIRTDALLACFGAKVGVEPDAGAGEPRTYGDVLDAYRDLPRRKVRRLVVLGEPGAGKSFSLQRIALEYADRALSDPQAPIPVLVELGGWTRDAEPLEPFIERTLGELGRHLPALRSERRTVLLLDAINEIPPGQRVRKARQIEDLARDERFVSVVASCREKDFRDHFSLPFDTLTLQALSPGRIRDYLHRVCQRQYEQDATEPAEACFWQLAGGEAVREAWRAWEAAGAGFELFWNAEVIPCEQPNVFSKTTGEQDRAWRAARFNPRSLIRLAANPYLLVVMTALWMRGEFTALSANRARLFLGFLNVLHQREKAKREQCHHGASVPDEGAWLAALTELAETLQRASGAAGDDGAQTVLPRSQWPAALTPALLDFSLDASVLQRTGGDLRFSHQLLQEYLASRALLAAQAAPEGARRYWPPDRWWQRSGWEVVAEIAAESLDTDAEREDLIRWLARANPEVAHDVWRASGAFALGVATLDALRGQWLPRMTDVTLAPAPPERAAIGRALGRFGLDRRRGVGLRPDGLPDIEWVEVPGGPFLYLEGETRDLPTFFLARYPVTHAQYQAFIDGGGYEQDEWWKGLAERIKAPAEASWDEPNGPRETVSWYEAVAYSRWLSARLGYPVSLPTEEQWEKAARGGDGREYPWGNGYRVGYANCGEGAEAGGLSLHRTAAVGLYPQGRSPMGAEDMAGNVWEWCLNEFGNPNNIACAGGVARVLRGGSWDLNPRWCRAAYRFFNVPVYRTWNFGFRVCCSSPIE